MTKTDTALRVELEDLKNQFFELNQYVQRQRVRTDRIVQVLLNTLPQNVLQSKVNFTGEDCYGIKRNWYPGNGFTTLEDFLRVIIDP